MNTTEKPLPHNLHLEEMILAGLMISTELRIATKHIFSLNVEWFYNPKNQIIYNVMRELVLLRQVPDFLAVLQRLNEKQLAEAGGEDRLMQIVSLECTTALLSQRINELKIIGIQRLAIIECLMTSESLQTLDVKETIDNHYAKMNKLQKAYIQTQKRTTADLVDSILEKLSNPEKSEQVKFHYIPADNEIYFCKKQIMIIGAKPKTGKTALINKFQLNQSLAGMNTMMICLESSAEQQIARMACQLAGCSLTETKTGFNGNKVLATNYAEALQRIRKLDRMAIYGVGDGIKDLYGVEGRVQEYIEEFKHLDCLYLDYLQRLAPLPEYSRCNIREKTDANVMFFSNLVKDYNFAGVLLSQLSRSQDDSRPTSQRLKESSTIEQEADIIAFLHYQTKKSDAPIRPIEFFADDTRTIEPFSMSLAFEGKCMDFPGYFSTIY